MNLKQIFTKRLPEDFKVKRTMDIEVKRATDKEMLKELGLDDINELPEGFIAGWASTDDIDHIGDKVAPSAFDKSIAEKGLTGPKGIKLLAQHQSDKPAGRITKLERRGNGLWIEAQLNLKISYVADLYEAAKDNGGLSFSIGYRLVEGGFKFVDNGKDAESYWLLEQLDLHEVSVVTFPCNDEAEMVIIKGITDEEAFDNIADLEKALVASGLVNSRNDANRITRVVKRNSSLYTATPTEPVLASDTKALENLSSTLDELNKVFT